MFVRRVDLGPGVQPGAGGYVSAYRGQGGWTFDAVVAPDLSPEGTAEFSSWADRLVDRMVEDGPAVDGWQPSGDGGWVLWARAEQLTF